MADETLLVISTFPDVVTARPVARQLVEEKLAACANIVPVIESIYRWEGKMEEARETLVFFKTTPSRFPELRARLTSLHPYDTPEVIAIAVTAGSPEYLRWVAESCA